MSKPVIKTYQFKLKPGIDEQQFLDVNVKVQQFLQTQPGYQYRSVAKNEDGLWLDVIYFADATLLSQVDSGFNDNPDCVEMLMLIDLTSIVAQQAEIVYSADCTAAA